MLLDTPDRPYPHYPDSPAICVPRPELAVPDFGGTAVGLAAECNCSSKYYKVGSYFSSFSWFISSIRFK